MDEKERENKNSLPKNNNAPSDQVANQSIVFGEIKSFLLDDVQLAPVALTDYQILFFDLDGRLQCWDFLSPLLSLN